MGSQLGVPLSGLTVSSTVFAQLTRTHHRPQCVQEELQGAASMHCVVHIDNTVQNHELNVSNLTTVPCQSQ